MAAQRVHHLVQTVLGHHARLDRLAAGRHLVQAADIHLAVIGQRQGARDRRRGHGEEMRRGLALGGQHHPLRHAEAVLFVHHHQREVAIGHGVLEDRMGADEDVDLPAASAINVASRALPLSRPVSTAISSGSPASVFRSVS